MILIQEYFLSKNLERKKEIDEVLKENVSNENINKIYLLNENYETLPISSSKIEQIITGKRLTFKKAFEFANNFPGEIIIICNNDISFTIPERDNNNSFKKIKEILEDQNKIITLSRYEIINGSLDPNTVHDNSQDTWIFRTPIKIPKDSNFFFGTLGCDCRIAKTLSDEGYTLVNPMGSIISIHHHKSGSRTYKKDYYINGEYMEVKRDLTGFKNTKLYDTPVYDTYNTYNTYNVKTENFNTEKYITKKTRELIILITFTIFTIFTFFIFLLYFNSQKIKKTRNNYK